MKIFLAMLFSALFFIGCSDDKAVENAQAKLVVGKSLEDLKLNDQHKKPQTLPQDTKYVIFSFSKPVGHICNAFLEAHPADFLPKHHIVYVADVSPAPGIIKNMFILPDLEKLPFPILLINDDVLSAEYSKGINKEKIVVVELDNLKIINIKYLNDEKELEALFK